MKIEVRSTSLDLDRSTARVVLNHTARGLHRFSHRLKRVVVRLADVNGPRGGNDIECAIQLHQEGLPILVIKKLERDPLRAASAAIASCRRAIERRGQRRQKLQQMANACALGTLVMFGAACAGPTLEVGSRGADVLVSASPQTYSLLGHGLAREAAAADVMEAELHRGLRAKGLSLATSDGAPDLLVDYKLLVDEGQDMVGSKAHQTQMVGADSGGLDALAAVEDGRKEKILVVTLQDANSLELLWVGWTRANVKTKNVVEASRTALTEILSRLPVPNRPASG